MRFGLKGRSAPPTSGRGGFSLRVALSYSVFLLLCLALSVGLYGSSTRNARETFWEQRAVHLESSAATMSHHLATLDNYTRQLLLNSTFVRFANMEGIGESDFIYTAYKMMQDLAPRNYLLMELPVTDCHIYLKKSNYVISGNQFTESLSYYMDYRHFVSDRYDDWQGLLLSATAEGGLYDVSAFTGVNGSRFYIRDIDAMLTRKLPAVIWFEMDMTQLERLFLPEGAETGTFVVLCDSHGKPQGTLPADADPALAAAALTAAYDDEGFATLGDLRLIQRTGGADGWRYVMVQPLSVCDAALGNYDAPFIGMLVLALLAGGAMVGLLVRHNMRPIRQLNTQLEQAEDDKALLRQELDSQRPVLQASYLRKLLSGHVTTDEEFHYMMKFLGLDSCRCFYVLYCVAHRQDSEQSDPVREHNIIADNLTRYLQGGFPLHFYTTLSNSFVALVGYGEDVSDPLMDLQKRVIDLHDALLTQHSLWFSAGVGSRRDEPQRLWESYEQARAAARYTAKQHVFVPYEFIQKDSDSFYYPSELSSKLQHFITTGNRQQVSELFALLHEENMVERTLSLPLLNFLLTDLKNTLLKARFQIHPSTPEEEERLRVIDQRLYEPPTFPILEDSALLLCGFFVRTADPSDPIPEVERYLQENFADPSMCLSKLSDQFHISESYLSHLFKSRTGQNFSVYLEDLRLSEAQNRLRDKDCNLTTLYSELGYNNAATFRRAFKKRFGITPSEMRQQG